MPGSILKRAFGASAGDWKRADGSPESSISIWISVAGIDPVLTIGSEHSNSEESTSCEYVICPDGLPPIVTQGLMLMHIWYAVTRTAVPATSSAAIGMAFSRLNAAARPITRRNMNKNGTTTRQLGSTMGSMPENRMP